MSIYSYAFENGNHNEDKDGGHEGNVINRQTNDTRSFELLALLSVLVSQFSSVQLLSHVQLFATPWTAACQASLSITNSQSLLKLMAIESVIPSDHLILCRPLLLLPSSFPTPGFFLICQLLTACGQSIGASASASVLPMNIQD